MKYQCWLRISDLHSFRNGRNILRSNEVDVRTPLQSRVRNTFRRQYEKQPFHIILHVNGNEDYVSLVSIG